MLLKHHHKQLPFKPQDSSTSSGSVAGVLVQETTSLAAQDALVPSSSSSLAVQAANDQTPEIVEEILRSLHISEYPKAWHYSPENPIDIYIYRDGRGRNSGAPLAAVSQP
jgi:hypothetical protein